MSDDKGGKVRQRDFVLVASFVFVLVLVGFVFAAQLVYPTTGQGTNFTAVGQHISNFYNITINNTNIAGENITEIVILLNRTGQQINITDGTLNSSFGVGSSTNWSVNISSGAAVKIQGLGNVGYVWFNATADSAVKVGNFTFIMTANGTTVYRNLSSVNINDTFTVEYVGKSNASGTNLSQNYVPLHLNITGNQTTISLRVSFYNSTNELYRNISIGGAVVNGSGIQYNFSNLTTGVDLPDGVYTLEVIANNSDGDMNNTANRTYRLDMTAPSVTVVQANGSTDTTKTQITLTATISDSGAGIGSSCQSSTGTVVTGTGTTQTIVQSGLNCGTRYNYDVVCTDLAGNQNVAVTYSAATLSCGGGSSGGNPSGSGSPSGGSPSGGSAPNNGSSSSTGNAGASGGSGASGSGLQGNQNQSSGSGSSPVIWIIVVLVLLGGVIAYVVMHKKKSM